MSRMTITRYRDLEAERRRAEQRESQRIRKDLQNCLLLEESLANLEDVPASEYANLLARIDGAQQPLSPNERKWWLERLPSEIERLENTIAIAKERRISLQFTALSLMPLADEGTQRILNAYVKRARQANGAEFSSMRAALEALVTKQMSVNRTRTNSPQTDQGLKLATALMLAPGDSQPELPQSSLGEESKFKKLITDLAALGPEAGDLLDRAQTLASSQEALGFELKLDSLTIEASELNAAARIRRELNKQISGAEDVLAPFDDPSSSALKVRLDQLRLTFDGDAIRAAVAEAKKHAEQIARKEDAGRARGAIVMGLRDLGYEVEVQPSGWEQGERIAVRKSHEPNYDVQLASASDGRIQSKVRAYAHAGRSRGVNDRDIEMESSWCADLKLLNERLRANGIETHLDHEDAPGSGVPVPIERNDRDSDVRTNSPRTRTQPRN